jgi:cold shock CspA family protein
MKGTARFFNRVKGWGFIIPEEGGPDVFVHHTAIVDKKKDNPLVEKQAVEFETVQGERGMIAVGVKGI